MTAGAAALANYPTTVGAVALREAIADWLTRRHALPSLDPATQVLPVLGSREALFAFAQTVLDGAQPGATVVVPNPFYQIYEGAALLAGAQIHCVNADPETGFAHDWAACPGRRFGRARSCSTCARRTIPPGACWILPAGVNSSRCRTATASPSRRTNVIRRSTSTRPRPPLGASRRRRMRSAARGFPRLVVFGSLSKRSNAPGLRSGYVAGDPALLQRFLLYRTYHGSAMSGAVAAASIAAWNDEAHVRANRVEYNAKFSKLQPLLASVLPCAMPEAAFYLWASTPIDDAAFARRLLAEENVLVLPGSFVAREADGRNPGERRIRIALVASGEECAEGIERIVAFARRG